MQEEEVLVLLGGNQGPVADTLGSAEAKIEERCGKVLARSRDHWTRPWGFEAPELFLNRVLLIHTRMDPEQMLLELLSIERELGRTRPVHGGPASRTLDADILLFGDRIIDRATLQVPHPRMHERAFALAPAADVAPSMLHPVLRRSVLSLLDELRTRPMGAMVP